MARQPDRSWNDPGHQHGYGTLRVCPSARVSRVKHMEVPGAPPADVRPPQQLQQHPPGRSPETRCHEAPHLPQGLSVVTLGEMKSLSDVGEIPRSAENDTSQKAGRSDKQHVLGQPPCGQGMSGSAGVAVRCVILWGKRGRWRLVSHGEGVFCGTFKAGK